MTKEEAINRYVMPAIKRTWNDNLCAEIEKALEQEPNREIEDYENEIEYLQNRLDIAEYDKERLRLEAKIQALEQKPCGETVSLETFKQVMWERDIAIEQLKELGYELGQKIEPCEDAISRDAVLEKAGYTETEEGWCGYTVDVDYIKSLPPVNPQEPSITWVTGADGAKIAFWDVPVWKVTKICEILGAPQESDHKFHTCHTCKHYTSGAHDGSCGSYICKGYSNWESEVRNEI